MNRFQRFWDNLRSSFWFVPSQIVLLAVILAAVLIDTDSAGSDQWLAKWPHLFGAEAEGARGMMSTIAGSMMSVVGVTFSMILVVLALASSQYTSRVLRNFMRSRITQVVLGIFAGIFAYCLIVLRTIRGGNEEAFVPNLAVFFGFVLALVGVGALMFFLHHIASSIQASSIIASVAKETIGAMDRQFPEEPSGVPVEDGDGPTPGDLAERTWRAVAANESGYVQSVNYAALLRLARDRETTVSMEHGIGEFVVQSTTLASLALEEPPDPQSIAAVQASISIGPHRTVEQDAAYGIRQIVDVALKALSPGINDTTTAATCVDYLTTLLARIAPRRIPSPYQYADGTLRVIAKRPSFESLLAESFDQIRNNAKSNVAILSQMLDALRTLAILTVCPRRSQALGEQARWIAEAAERNVESAHDRSAIDMGLTRVLEAVDAEPPSMAVQESKSS